MKLDFFSDINKEHYFSLRYPDVDRLMVRILWWHFVVVFIGALLIYFLEPSQYRQSPFSWRVISLDATLWVIVIGFLASLIPTLFLGEIKNHYYYRLLVANCLFVYSYIIVFDTGGSIEGHFHFFVVFVLLAIYYDWRLGWVGLVAVALHHSILNVIEPNWVYFYGRNDLSVVAHALPVAVAALYLTWVSNNGRRLITFGATANKELEAKLRNKIPGLSINKSNE